MDVELLSRAKIRDIEREISRIRLSEAARRVASNGRRGVPGPEPRAVRAVPLRLLQALRAAI
jgi:hypothetical protein